MRNHVSRFSAAAALAVLLAAAVNRDLAVEPLLAQGGPNCSVLLDKTGAIAPITGGTFTVTVFPNPAGCTFQVSALTPGVGTIVEGPGHTAVVTVLPNPGTAAREALFQIGDQVFRVVQAGENAQTPWNIGDVFVGAGSFADSPGVYKTLAPQGSPKLDTGSATPASAVPDLLDGAGQFTNGCMVDPTAPDGNGHLFTAAWTANTLSIFDGVTHQLRDVFPFTDPSTIHPILGVGLNTPLAALPFTTAQPLPPAAIGIPDNPSTPEDEFVAPDIQAFEQVVFADNGEFYVGTQTPPFSNDLGLGHGYLLRFRYVPDARRTRPRRGDPVAPAAKLTLTGWWKLDAGAIADRSAERLLFGPQYANGTSNGAAGVEQFDLSSNQQTIFYTSEDAFIRHFNVVTGAAGAMELKNTDGQPLGVKAYGIRILPGPPDSLGNPTGDGSAGFLVATSNNLHENVVVRVDATGKTIARYVVPGQPFALNLTPDAQYFWTAITQAQPDAPNVMGGIVYRFHIASGARESFKPGTTGVYGLCVKREYSAATSAGQCFNIQPGGSYSSVDTSACRTPTICSAIPGRDISNQDNADCFEPGFTPPVFENQGPHPMGTVVNLDLNRPGITVRGVIGLDAIAGLQFAGGVITGTIGTSTCAPVPPADPNAPATCVFDQLRVQWVPGSNATNVLHWLETPFTWTVVTHFSNRAPVCSAATVTPRLLWPPNHKLVPFSIQNVTDPDGDALTIVITSIAQNQPVNGKGDGNTRFDATGVGTSSGAVRAERTGNLRVPGDGRLYFISFTATDGRGGTCDSGDRPVTIGVPHDQGRRNQPTDNGCRWDSVTRDLIGSCAWLNAPVLTLSNRTNVAGSAINLQVTARDPDGTPLTYSAAGLPPGLSISSSGLITGTIAPGASGGKSKKYAVTVTVSDGFGTAKSTFTWTLTRP